MAKDKETEVQPEKLRPIRPGVRLLTGPGGAEHEYFVEQVGDQFRCTPHSFSGEVEIRDSIE